MCTKIALCFNGIPVLPFIHFLQSLNVERRSGVIVTNARCWLIDCWIERLVVRKENILGDLELYNIIINIWYHLVRLN